MDATIRPPDCGQKLILEQLLASASNTANVGSLLDALNAISPKSDTVVLSGMSLGQTIKCEALRSFMDALNSKCLLEEVMTKLSDLLMELADTEGETPNRPLLNVVQTNDEANEPSRGIESKPKQYIATKLVVTLDCTSHEMPDPSLKNAAETELKKGIPTFPLTTQVTLESFDDIEDSSSTPQVPLKINVGDLLETIKFITRSDSECEQPQRIDEDVVESLIRILGRLTRKDARTENESVAPKIMKCGFEQIDLVIKEDECPFTESEPNQDSVHRNKIHGVANLLKDIVKELKRQDVGTKPGTSSIVQQLFSELRNSDTSKLEATVDSIVSSIRLGMAPLNQAHIYLDPNATARLAAMLLSFKESISKSRLKKKLELLRERSRDGDSELSEEDREELDYLNSQSSSGGAKSPHKRAANQSEGQLSISLANCFFGLR